MKVFFLLFTAVFIAALTGLVHCRAAKESSSTEQYQKLCKTITANNCTVESVVVDSISEKSLIDNLEGQAFEQRHTALIGQYFHYFVSITFKKPPDGNSTQIAAVVGNMLDQFFAPRPWWLIRKYPYEPHESESEQNVMILERVPALIEISSRAIITANSPPLEGCKTRLKNVKIGLGSWGNDLVANFPAFFNHHPEHIKMLYATHTGNVRDHVGFVEPMSCPTNIDKYTCVFLPISNCSLPEELVACKEDACMKEGLYSPDGKRLEKEPEDSKFSHKAPWYPESFELSKRYNIEYIHYKGMRLKDSYGPLVESNVEFVERDDLWGALHQQNYVFNLLNRFNYRMGLKVQDFVNREIFDAKVGLLVNLNTASSNNNTPKEIPAPILNSPFLAGVMSENSCVATHIRMGDRHVENASMVNWCQEHTRPGATGDNRAFGTWYKDGNNLTMGQWHDMGCSARLPFGALSLIKVSTFFLQFCSSFYLILLVHYTFR